jgi:glycosyltransferase involved in cell wall biosynthesis
MACGIPVVASPVGANRSIVRHAVEGYLPEDDQGWADSLRRLLEDPARRASMGAAGRVRAVDAYALHVMAPQLVQTLSDAAGRAVTRA